MRRIKSKHFSPSGDIRKVAIRDYYGNVIYKSTVNTSDKKNLVRSFIEEARLCGLNIDIKDDVVKKIKEEDRKLKEELRRKVRNSIEETNKKVKEFLSKKILS